MIKLTITKQGEVNRIHGHNWDLMVGVITKALNKYENAFHGGKSKNNEITQKIQRTKK